MTEDTGTLAEPTEEVNEDGGMTGAIIKLSDLARPGAALPQLTKEQMGLLHKILSGNQEKSDFTFLRTGYFEDDEDSRNFTAAFIELKENGITTDLLEADFHASCSVNRKGAWGNLIGSLTDALQHAKFGMNPQQQYNRRYGGNNRPLQE